MQLVHKWGPTSSVGSQTAWVPLDVSYYLEKVMATFGLPNGRLLTLIFRDMYIRTLYALILPGIALHLIELHVMGIDILHLHTHCVHADVYKQHITQRMHFRMLLLSCLRDAMGSLTSAWHGFSSGCTQGLKLLEKPHEAHPHPEGPARCFHSSGLRSQEKSNESTEWKKK